MNKLVNLIFFIIVGFTGFFILTNPLQLQQWLTQATATLQGLVQPIQPMIQGLIASITQNPVATISGMAISGIPLFLLVSKAYSNIKTRLSARVQQVTDQKNIVEEQANSKITDLQSKLKEAEETNQDLTNKLTATSGDALVEAQKLVTQQRQELTNNQTTINELHSVIKDLKMQVVEKIVVK